MRILITGGAGYIGSVTARAIRRAGLDVVVLDNLSCGHREAVTGFELVVRDLYSDTLDDLVSRCDAILHFAGRALVPESVTQPSLYYRDNVVGSWRLFESMRRCGVHRIVFSSTCATYGLPESVPLAETHSQAPVTSYGSSKLCVEHMLRDFATAYGFAAVALRYFNAAGAAQDGTTGENHTPETHLIPNVLQAAVDGSPVTVCGTDYATSDGTCVRDFIHVEDLARAHILALEAALPGQFRAFNIGSGVGFSVRQVIDVAQEVCGRPIPSIDGPPRAGDPPVLLANIDHARAHLGFAPASSLHEIIGSAWQWHQQLHRDSLV